MWGTQIRPGVILNEVAAATEAKNDTRAFLPETTRLRVHILWKNSSPTLRDAKDVAPDEPLCTQRSSAESGRLVVNEADSFCEVMV